MLDYIQETSSPLPTSLPHNFGMTLLQVKFTPHNTMPGRAGGWRHPALDQIATDSHTLWLRNPATLSGLVGQFQDLTGSLFEHLA